MRWWWLAMWMAGCTGAGADCPPCEEGAGSAGTDPTQAAAAPATEASTTLSPFEAEALDELLTELRAGPTPFDDSAWGVCSGQTRCGEYVGADAGMLPAGDHVVAARLAVPTLGGPWKVRFDLRCTTTNHADQTRDNEHSREYTVGVKPNGGYRLDPLFRIQSPHPGGARECTYSLTPHPQRRHRARRRGRQLQDAAGQQVTGPARGAVRRCGRG